MLDWCTHRINSNLKCSEIRLKIILFLTLPLEPANAGCRLQHARPSTHACQIQNNTKSEKKKKKISPKLTKIKSRPSVHQHRPHHNRQIIKGQIL